jgi:hypothetical protein
MRELNSPGDLADLAATVHRQFGFFVGDGELDRRGCRLGGGERRRQERRQEQRGGNGFERYAEISPV